MHAFSRLRLMTGLAAALALGAVAAACVPDEEATAYVEALPSFTVHAVDVGTGLAVLVEGPDFFLVYDGGSRDDRRTGGNNRLLAYMTASFPNLRAIDHVILSHPHEDHVVLLPDLFDVYEVGQVWDSGRVYQTCGYVRFLARIAEGGAASYHNARVDSGAHTASFAPGSCGYGEGVTPEFTITTGARIPEDPVPLGAHAAMRFLYADGDDHGRPSLNPNHNSLVVHIDFGSAALLLTGDAEGGRRSDAHEDEPAPDSIEGRLLACCRDGLAADILVVGHHGSRTSSRAPFLDAVGAAHFVISSGPFPYSGVVLPDAEIVAALEARGVLWRTDIDDEACRLATDKIGAPADGRPGGCDNIRLRIGADGVSGAYWPSRP